MAPEVNQLLQEGLAISAGTGAIVALVMYIRRIFKNMGLEDAQMESTSKAMSANDVVLDNLQGEVYRLSKRVGALEEQVAQLKEKLANVRLMALECYEIALQCNCANETRHELLDRIREIIKEA